jgi:flagellar FliL protein
VATKPSAEEVTDEKPKSKKKLVIAAVVAVVVLLVAGAGLFFMSRQDALDEEDEAVVQPSAPKGPPIYLPLENMVVNLADPGGEKVAQVGITLELSSPKAPEQVKPYLPAIRSSVLMLVSQRKSEELLQKEGKEQLAADILAEASRHFVTEDPAASGEDEPKKKKKKKKGDHKSEDENPVRRVLFSSFIVQ